MADDNYSRSHRAGDPHRRPAQPARQSSGNDPLAELARLIGQTDPFSDFAREQGRAAQTRHDPRRREPPSAPLPLDWPSAQERYRQPAADPRSYGRSHDYNQDDRGYADPRSDQGGHGYHHPDQYDDEPHGYQDDPQSYARQPHPQGYPRQDDHAYGADPYYGQMPHDEDMYEQPRKARRGGLVTVMAVLALAVLGTAAAFGYRAVFGTPSVPATPPVIKASSAPTKIVPATQAGDPSGKLIYDRVGDPNQPERLVSREEKPVELKNAAQPRVVLPSGIAPQAQQSAPLQPQNPPAFAADMPQSGSVKPPSSAPAPTAALTEPKKVRTVTIRPDQPDAPAPQPETTQTAPARTADEAPAAAPRATDVPRESAGQGESTAPLSLVPSGGSARAPMRTASAPTQHAPTTAGLQGAYSVQVTSQRSEAEAQASYRALQAQFPNVLGSHQAVIRRADLGSRGIYYRALVGSFGSSEQASDFCRNLRDAGGQCVVQRN